MTLRNQRLLGEITVRRKACDNKLHTNYRQTNYHSLITPALSLIRLLTTCSKKKRHTKQESAGIINHSSVSKYEMNNVVMQTKKRSQYQLLMLLKKSTKYLFGGLLYVEFSACYSAAIDAALPLVLVVVCYWLIAVSVPDGFL
jgi:ABC-type Mn2+/Zn2+ transport system permease subunit